MLRLYAAKLMSIQTRVHAVTSDGLDAARAVESITAGLRTGGQHAHHARAQPTLARILKTWSVSRSFGV